MSGAAARSEFVMGEPTDRFSALRFPKVRSTLVTMIMVASAMGGIVLLPGAAAVSAPAPHSTLAPAVNPNTLQSGAQLQHGQFTTYGGTGLTQFPNTTVTGPVPSNDPVSFTIGFTPQNTSLMNDILSAQQTPGSPWYHKWLSQAQEASMFGPNPVVVQNTINYFTSLGFRVGTEGPISISFIGPAQSVNTAFQTQLVNVHLGPGAGVPSTAMTNGQPLSLPNAFAGAVASVNGLSSYQMGQVQHFVDPANAGDVVVGQGSAMPSSATEAATVNTSQIFNFTNHAFTWLHYYSTSRKAFRSTQFITPGSLDYMYNATSLLNAGYNGNSTGTPIRVAIVMAGGINPGDIKGYGQIVFNNPNAIWNRLVADPVDGSFTTNGTVTYNDGDSGEMALDIEYSATMALGATILAVYGPCLCTNVLDDDYATIDQLPIGQFPSVISNSWGGSEDANFGGNLYGPNWQNSETMHYYFGLLDLRGATVLASSGDGGGFDTGTGMLSGSYPATDPYVLSVDGLRTSETTSVGGSSFPATDTIGLSDQTICEATNLCLFYQYPVHVSTATNLESQSYWYEPLRNTTLYNSPPEASGGFGLSYLFNQSWEQTGIGVPYVGRALGSGVAAEADFNMTIYFDGGFEWFYGGTSFACPTTAGMFGLIDDYLNAHGQGAYLGDGYFPTFRVGNAWLNHNVSLNPYYDVAYNGTSYWGNIGVTHQYSWPAGQNFPVAAGGYPVYGNTTPGWDFPTGWGSINVYNFAHDLLTLESDPAQFSILNAAGNAVDPGAWAYMVLNRTYTVHMAASGSFFTSNPEVNVLFRPESGGLYSVHPAVHATGNVSSGYNFVLDTSISPFNSPGLIIFEANNSTAHSAGFDYTWISYPTPSGNLSVQVVAPNEPNGMVGGYAEFNPWPFGYDAPITVAPSCCTDYPNSFTVRVTFDGRPVYNAIVTATIPNPGVLAWQGSKAQTVTTGNGHTEYYQTYATVSQTFTNLTGYALVDTWNVIQPTNFSVQATYGTATAGTSYQVLPGPNVQATDDYNGNYSALNTVAFILKDLRQPVNGPNENAWVANSVNQNGYYDMIYAWAGEELSVHTNDYTGTALPYQHVWFGNLDIGGENKFYHYEPTFGVVGTTNTSGTWTTTDANGNGYVYIPQNQSMNFWLTNTGADFAGGGYLATSIPGAVNRTFSYTEPCAPTLPNIRVTITCRYNDTWERNYTATPVIVFPDPVKAWTETTAKVQRDFFGAGASVAAAVSVNLPTNDPFLNGFGYNWPSSLEHVVTAKAYVDGVFAGDLSPTSPPDWQVYNASVNLTGTWSAGTHTLDIVVNDSEGHMFTSHHTFVIGSITITGVSSTYSVIPFNLTWNLNIPSGEVNNHTFNQTLDFRYVAGGCGSVFNPCPTVVNYSMPIRYGITTYYQLVNMTLLNLKGFYTGAPQLPTGQYQIIVWLNANHSGSIAQEVNTYLVFDPIRGFINGPGANESVPLGNVTISYSYSGDYVTSANLTVYAKSNLQVPIFNVIAIVPGFGGELVGGSASWTAVLAGPYQIQLQLNTSYGPATIYRNITVVNGGQSAYVNQTAGSRPIGGLSAPETATILALVAAILGLLIGLWVAPSLRTNGTNGTTPKAGPKPWEEGRGSKQATAIICPVCKDEFSTELALSEHQKIVHGIEH